MHKKYKIPLLFVVTAFLFFTVFSQQNKQGMISGTVKDAKTKSPVREAVITLSSSAFKGQKFAITDSLGVYKINNLPPGKYTISFEMEGYEKCIRDSLTLKDSMSLAIDNEMEKENQVRKL